MTCNDANSEDTEVAICGNYRHLGTLVDITSNMFPEVRNRVYAAMNVYAPLAQYLFGSASLCTPRNLAMTQSLVFSRLFFNEHIWQAVKGEPRRIEHATYASRETDCQCTETYELSDL